MNKRRRSWQNCGPANYRRCRIGTNPLYLVNPVQMKLLQRGVDIRSIQERLGHSHVATTEVYTHVLKAMQGTVRSPLDDL
ncbi:hypothetical protein BH11VER1_BH11VER1_26690 [soil metagenome]